MPFQILMAFHFLESRKWRRGADDFPGVKILPEPNPGRAAAALAPAGRARRAAVAAAPEQWCRRAPRPRAQPGPPRRGLAPPPRQRAEREAGLGVPGRAETARGRGPPGSATSAGIWRQRVVPPPQLQPRNFVRQDRLGAGKGPLSVVRLLGGDCGPFTAQPQAQGSRATLQGPGLTGPPHRHPQGSGPRRGEKRRAGGGAGGGGSG